MNSRSNSKRHIGSKNERTTNYHEKTHNINLKKKTDTEWGMNGLIKTISKIIS